MKFQSWNRFKTRNFAVQPSLMGCSTTFVHGGSSVTIKIPTLERVGDSHDEDALATCNCWKSSTGEPLYYHVHAVDVTTFCPSEVELPKAVLEQPPVAYKLIDVSTQKLLDSIAGTASVTAISAFEYWASLLRWVTGFHPICREARVGSKSGWSTYLHDSHTQKSVWIATQAAVVPFVHAVTPEEWQHVQTHAAAGTQAPMHVVLLQDAKHCIDVDDFRRALVDLCVACEVFLRTTVVGALPPGVQEGAVRLIEEANINQFVSHLFPALLTETAQEQYKKSIKDDLHSLIARRNKLMHVAEMEGANREACERYRKAVEALFRLKLRC